MSVQGCWARGPCKLGGGDLLLTCITEHVELCQPSGNQADNLVEGIAVHGIAMVGWHSTCRLGGVQAVPLLLAPPESCNHDSEQHSHHRVLACAPRSMNAPVMVEVPEHVSDPLEVRHPAALQKHPENAYFSSVHQPVLTCVVSRCASIMQKNAQNTSYEAVKACCEHMVCWRPLRLTLHGQWCRLQCSS